MTASFSCSFWVFFSRRTTWMARSRKKLVLILSSMSCIAWYYQHMDIMIVAGGFYKSVLVFSSQWSGVYDENFVTMSIIAPMLRFVCMYISNKVSSFNSTIANRKGPLNSSWLYFHSEWFKNVPGGLFCACWLLMLNQFSVGILIHGLQPTTLLSVTSGNYEITKMLIVNYEILY